MLHASTSFIGIKLCYLLLSVTVSLCLPDGDLCKWMNGRKYYIEVGETGIISVSNATSVNKPDLLTAGQQPQIPQRCSVELITCPSCHLEIAVLHLNIPSCSADETCRCDFVWIKESAYSKSGREYCGHKDTNSSDVVYESKTKLVSIDFLYSSSYTDAFALQFSAKKNVYVYKGSYGHDYYKGNATGIIRSPNFPGGYPSDYSAEFVLQNIDNTGFVQLIFIDFQLSLWSFIEVFDSNGSRIDIYNGNIFRPPAIISSGPVLTVKFQANDEYPSSGFQAKYTFVSYPDKYWINRPSTDCGGFVEDYGGAITMMNMVPSNTLRAFDCIWLIRPRNSHIPDTQIAIRVAQFEEMGPKSTLSIRQGLNSDAPLLESVTTYQHHKMPRGQEYVVAATSGFYIRLIGYFTNKSHLAIIYTTFRYEGCYGVADFECDNRRCVKNVLRCDGFNHCGDGSDEASCYGTNQGTTVPEDANWWRTLTPNYYFPKPDSSSGAGTNTLILVTSLAGLGMFVLTTIMILVKLHRQRQDDSVSREILHTVSGDIDMDNSPAHHGASDLPLYDPPPSYEDVIKLYLPPPPPYSSVGQGRTRTNRTARPHGVENRAYRTDSPNNATRDHHRRPRQQRHVIHESPHPLILKVSLPNENISRSCDTHATSSREVVASNRTVEQNQQKESLDLIQIGGASESQRSALVFKEHPSTSPRSSAVIGFDAGEVSKDGDTTVMVSCECQGACSCQLINANKQVKRSCSETKVTICSHSGVLSVVDKTQVAKKRSFKDMMQKGIKRAASSAIIPHPTSMTINVRPPKSRKSANSTGSKSAGPSSPTATCFSEEADAVNRRNLLHSSNELGHRRTSSGPIQMSSSFYCIADFPPDVASAQKASSDIASPRSSVSDEEIAGQTPHLKQIKNFASILLDGLHQSFNSLTDDTSTNFPISENKELNQNVQKRLLEQSEQLNSKIKNSMWVSSDTQPLLQNNLSQGAIVKFDSKTSSDACNPMDARLTKELEKSHPQD